MSNYKGIHIHYINGARGDFLASILCNEENGFAFHRSIKNPLGYTKQHTQSQPNYSISRNLGLNGYLKILIIPTECQSLITIAYLRMVKKWANTATPMNLIWHTNDIYTDTIQNKKDYQNYDIVIPFKNLYDIEYIKSLYTKIHNNELTLTDEEIDLIRKNIDSQPNVFAEKEYAKAIAMLEQQYKDFKIEL
jgi:hypothetical protein